MAEITTALIKELREITGAGMLDCKSALAEANGSIEDAIDVLRKKGLKNVGKRAGNIAAEGCIGYYIHPGDQVACLVELNCETDFVARGQEFKDLAREIAMHVAAMKPLYVSEEEVPMDVLKREESIALDELPQDKKAFADKIVAGKIKSFMNETTLLNQTFVKDESKTIRQLVEGLSVKVGEKVAVRRFERFEVGEGVEKKSNSLGDDVRELTGVI
jgi:elongation factor Ts